MVTAGAQADWHDIAQHISLVSAGLKKPPRASKAYILSPHPDGLGPYKAMPKRNPISDLVVESCQTWLADNYAAKNPIAEMISRSGSAPRTVPHRFARPTDRPVISRWSMSNH